MEAQSNPLVSIGISTYNRADGYLREALQSAVDQTYRNLEIIVSDNCSDDDTPGVVREFQDPRIRFFRQSVNIGANANFNFCLHQARGEYFLLLHDDDRIDPDLVERCMEAVDFQGGVGLIRTGTRIIDATGSVRNEAPNPASGLSTTDLLLSWFAGETAFYLCSTIYNTEYLKAVGGFQSPRDLFQDMVASVRLAARHGRADVEEVKASFRQHDQNRGTAARVEAWSEDSLHLLEVMCEEVPPEDVELVRAQGLRYFTRKSYRHTNNIRAPIERARTYWDVYRRFGRSYSPVRYLSSQQFRRLRRLFAGSGGSRGRAGSSGQSRAAATQGS
jgi:glycosyltransferase involved in cell wall biosynthesis